MFILFILIALIWFVWNQILYAPYSRKYDGFSVAFYRSIFLSIIMFPLAIFWDFSWLEVKTLGIILGIWFIWAFWVMIQFHAYKYLPAGIVAAIMNSYNIIILILGYLVYNETLSTNWYIWVVIILASSLILSLAKTNFSHLHSDYYKGIFLMFIRVFTYSTWVFWFSYYARALEPMSVAYLSELSVLLWFIPILLVKLFYIKDKNIFSIWKTDCIKLFFISILPAISSTAIFFAVLYWKIATVTLTLSTASIFTALFAYFFHNEKLNIIQFSAIFLSVAWLIFIHI